MVRLLGNWIALINGSDLRPFKCSRNTLVRLSYSCALASLCLTLSGCADLKVKQPASDSTPPSLVWNVLNIGTGDQADHPGSPNINVKFGESYRVTLKANDPEGVQWIELSSGFSFTCMGGGRGADGVLTSPKRQDLAPDPDGMVLTSIFLSGNVDIARDSLDCRGSDYESWQFAFIGKASNYFGGIRRESITFVAVP